MIRRNHGRLPREETQHKVRVSFLAMTPSLLTQIVYTSFLLSIRPLDSIFS